jgi:hypothetical protein
MQKRRLSTEWMALMGFLNIAGAAIYASRVSISLEMLFLASVWLTDNRYRSADFQLVLTL